MTIAKKYPKLLSSLVLAYGEEKGTDLLTGVINQGVEIEDSRVLSTAFVWDETSEGGQYWAKVHNEVCEAVGVSVFYTGE